MAETTTRRRRRWRPGVAAAAALALALTACGGNGGAGGGDGDGEATGDPIRIGAVFDLSGATADVGTPFAEGVRAHVAWVNEQGGIDGRPLELLSADYQYDVAQSEQLYSQYVSQGIVAFSGWGTGDTEALRARVTADEIPFVSASYAETLVNPEETPFNFVVALTYSDQMRLALQHIANEAGGERVEVVVFHHDSPFGTSPVADGRDYIEEQGYDMGYRAIAMPGGATDYTGELAQASGADYIVVQNVTSPAAQLARDIAAQGLDVTLVCLNWCADEGFVELAGSAAEGALGVLPWAPPTQAAGDLSDVESYLEGQGQSLEEVDLHFTQGWYQIGVLIEAIRQVVADGEEPTGPLIRDKLQTMEPYETPVSAPIQFSAEEHRGMKSGRIYEVQDGEWVAVTDELTP